MTPRDLLSHCAVDVSYRCPSAASHADLDKLCCRECDDQYLVLGNFDAPKVSWVSRQFPSATGFFSRGPRKAVYDLPPLLRVREPTRTVASQASVYDLILSLTWSDAQYINCPSFLGANDHPARMVR